MWRIVVPAGFEPATFWLWVSYSNHWVKGPKLLRISRRIGGNSNQLNYENEYSASNGTRTHDPNIKSVVLYQLSYERKMELWLKLFYKLNHNFFHTGILYDVWRIIDYLHLHLEIIESSCQHFGLTVCYWHYFVRFPITVLGNKTELTRTLIFREFINSYLVAVSKCCCEKVSHTFWVFWFLFLKFFASD